ncbi:MAG: cysteine--tRNA ligase [Oligoflexus sp.]
MRQIFVTNTLTGQKELLETLEPGHVKIYACGVTVYDDCHIGHAMQAVYFDVIRRYLEFAAYKVTYVRNYTDVDDKIINKAKELGISPRELAERVIQSSEKDMAAIKVKAPSFEPKVSESIPEIIGMIEDLVKKDFAYPTSSGDVYYRVRKKGDYGKLSNRDPEDMRSGSRELVMGEKEDELDFALWKHDETEGASWSSPWGPGRPGWHIECSAMSKKHLGASFDIHGGGRDLVFPHHENEIAQSEAANGCQYAKYWLHSGLLTINQQKMSKSLGNHIPISEFLKQYPGEVLRLAYLQHHYSSNVDFTEEVFKACMRRLLYFYESLLKLDDIAASATDAPGVALLDGHEPQQLVEQFHAAMSQDFSTVNALKELHLGFRKANELGKVKKSASKSQTAKAYAEVFRQLFGVLGLLTEDPKEFIEGLKRRILPDLGLSEKEVQHLIDERQAARQRKDFAASDRIRDELLAKGIELMDSPEGTKWTITI